jgi:amino acid transporter
MGTGLVVLLYLALNLFYALALSTADVKAIVEAPGNTQGPDAVTQIAGLSAARFFGPGLAGLISVAIGLTMLASLSAFILTGPRVIYAMSRAGQFPAFAGRLHPRSGTPHLATWLQAAWAIVVLWSGSFEKILVFASVGLALFSLLTVSAVYALRLRRPDLPRPFRTPGYPIVPGLYLLMTVLMTGAAFSERPDASLLSVACIVAGVPLAGGRKSSALAVTTLGGWGLSLLLAETKAGPLLGWWNAPGMLASQGQWFVNGVVALALGAAAGLSLRRIAGARRARLPFPLLQGVGLIALGAVGAAIPFAPRAYILPMLAAAFAIWVVVEAITPWPRSMPGPREGDPPA